MWGLLFACSLTDESSSHTDDVSRPSSSASKSREVFVVKMLLLIDKSVMIGRKKSCSYDPNVIYNADETGLYW